MLMDVANSRDKNVIKKEAEKILKYKDLITEVHFMWNVKPKVIPVITGATGTISKSLGQYLSSIPGQHEIRRIQKTAILGTAHILRGSAGVTVRNIFHGRNNITCSTDCKYRTAVILCTVETWFVSGI